MSVTLPERLSILREKLKAANAATLPVRRMIAHVALDDAVEEHLSAILSAHVLDDSAVIAIEGHRDDTYLPVVTAYPDGKCGWRVCGFLAGEYVVRPAADREAVLRAFADWGCTRPEVHLTVDLEMPKAAEGGAS